MIMREVKDFELFVNGEKIGAKMFVREIIANSLLGMVETLRLKDPNIKKINLKIEFEEGH